MATKTVKKKPAARTRTKAEVSAEFDEIRNQEPEELDRVSRDAKSAERARVQAVTADMKTENIVGLITTLGPTIQNNLVQLAQLLTEKTQELADLKAAVSIEEENLQNVHAIEVSATALENLKAEYTAKETELQTHITELEQRFAATKASLEKENSDRARELEVARKREEAEFKYNLDQARLKERTAYNQQLEDEKRANFIKQQGLEAGWSERTKELDVRQAELAALNAKVAGFDELLRKEVSKAEAITKNSTERDLNHKFALEKADLTSQIAMMNIQKAQSEKDKDTLAKTVLDLQNQLAAANKQVENIATKALESASGNLAMTKMQGVIEQTAAPNGGKRS